MCGIFLWLDLKQVSPDDIYIYICISICMYMYMFFFSIINSLLEVMYRFLPIPFQDKGMRWDSATPKTQLVVFAIVTSFFSFDSIK